MPRLLDLGFTVGVEGVVAGAAYYDVGELIASPPPPRTQSFPHRALMVSGPEVPRRRSAPLVPVTPTTTVVSVIAEQAAGLSVFAVIGVTYRVTFEPGTVLDAPNELPTDMQKSRRSRG